MAVLNLLLLLMMMRWGQLHYTLRMHLEQGGIYVSLADYDAASETEVSIKGRDRVELLKVGCAGWWFVKLLGNDLCILCVINMMYFLSMIWMDVSVDAGCEEISLIMFFFPSPGGDSQEGWAPASYLSPVKGDPNLLSEC